MSSELSFAIKVRQLDTLLSRRTRAWALLVLTFEIPYFFWNQVPQHLNYIWIGLNLLMFARSFWIYPWLMKTQRTGQNINRLLGVFTLNVSSASLVWSIMLPFFFVPENPQLLLVFLFTYSLLMIAGAIALASYMPAFIFYWLPFVISFSILFFNYSDGRAGVFGFGEGFLLFNCFIALLYRITNKEVIELITLRFEKEKLAEDLENKNQIAKQLAEDKSRFLAAASHDLRQPLHASGLLLSTLKNHITNREGERLLDGAITSMGALSNSFNSLLDVSKLDAGTVEVDIQDCSLQQMFHLIEQEFAVQAENKGLTFDVDQNSVMVTTDPELFGRIVRNLVSNAISYTERGYIKLGWELNEDNNQINVQVTDSGIGIPAEELENIFSEYYQLHNPERDRNRGFGLGLAIVKRLTKLLEIDLNVNSKVGTGTTFNLTLPKGGNKPTDNIVVSKLAPEQTMMDKTLLVIDDDSVVLESMESLLESWGCNVVCAESEEQAVQRMLDIRRPPDLVLADFRLRGNKTGIQAYERVNEEFNRKIPVIVISGDTSPERLQALRRSGYRLLHKPVGAEDLRQAIITELKSEA